MNKAEQIFSAYALAKIEGEPLPLQIELLHGFGCLVKESAPLAGKCHAMADVLEQIVKQIEAQHEQLRLDFKRGGEG